MDLKTALSFVQKALPWIGAAASGNVPALIALSADAVSGALGRPVEPAPDAIAQAVAAASPAELVKLRQADEELKLKAQALGFEHAEDMRKLDIQELQVLTTDVQSARSNFSKDRGVFLVGIVILITFALVMGAVLFGAYQLIVGGMKVSDPGIVAAIFGLVGTVLGYVASNAQQVVNYLFGSSKGSAQHSDVIADTMRDLASRLGGAPGPAK